jgi:hypothetical protein
MAAAKNFLNFAVGRSLIAIATGSAAAKSSALALVAAPGYSAAPTSAINFAPESS